MAFFITKCLVVSASGVKFAPFKLNASKRLHYYTVFHAVIPDSCVVGSILYIIIIYLYIYYTLHCKRCKLNGSKLLNSANTV